MFTKLFDQICATFDCAPSNRKKWKAKISNLSYSRPLTCFSCHEYLSADGVVCRGQPGWLARTTEVRNFYPDLERFKYSHVMPWPVCIPSNWIVIFWKILFHCRLARGVTNECQKMGERKWSTFIVFQFDRLLDWVFRLLLRSINESIVEAYFNFSKFCLSLNQPINLTKAIWIESEPDESINQSRGGGSFIELVGISWYSINWLINRSIDRVVVCWIGLIFFFSSPSSQSSSGLRQRLQIGQSGHADFSECSYGSADPLR